MSPLISIVVPCYKVEVYIRRCIDSILNQTYSHIEIILVDDGSPDRCGDICDEYAKLDGRVKVIHKKNGGLSDARNAGIDTATGDYITFIDSDDWIHEEYVQTLYRLMEQTGAEISACNFIRTSDESVSMNFTKSEVFEFSNIEALEQFSCKLKVQMEIAWCKLYKRSLFENIRYPVGRIHEDAFTTYKLIYKAKKMVFTTRQLYYYWQRIDSIMGVGFNVNNALDAIEAIDERAAFLKEIGLMNAYRKIFIKSLFFDYLCIYRLMDNIKDEKRKVEFLTKFKNLKYKLRQNNNGLWFRLFYELFYIAPKVMNFLHLKTFGLRKNFKI